MREPPAPPLNYVFELDVIEDRRKFPLLCPAFVMIAVLLSSCGGDSGIGSSGWEENHGNEIIVKMRRSSGRMQRYGTVMARDVYNDVVDGMRWAAGVPVTSALENRHPAKVVNLSVASVDACSWTFQDAIDDLMGQGVTVVAAASSDVVNEIDASPGCRNMISVTKSDQASRRVLGGNTHSRVTLSSPGTNIGALSHTGTRVPADASHGDMHGTSLAAPQVSGVVSLMLTTNPWLTPAEVASILKRTARFASIASETRSRRVISPGRGIHDAAGCCIDCCRRAK
ncbi:hypothetical protein EGT41_17925 [Burkholderia cenocepacia]|uniref:Peptidase S8/S53 domain-containing protein n=1 Tax=Burkholderia cenocepacia TaxID=95486 RepID=A0A427NSG0_9BURK|nr:S8 family serine peptidase [Burkholderia orbicola]RSC10336.1 hypothetical protein EGT41_17925 [Burkholderia cenocepacia]